MHEYKSPLTNYTYYLSNCNNATFDVSRTACNSMGGHLVSFQSEEEQQDAEGYFTGMGKRRAVACRCSLDYLLVATLTIVP